MTCNEKGCITCSGNRVVPPACDCDVKNGYYNVGKEKCPPCDYKCKTCSS